MTQGRIIIVGATGSIGRPLHALARAARRTVVATSRAGGAGLRSFDMVEGRLADLVPNLGAGDCAYVLGAMTSPDVVSRDPTAARGVNVTAAIRLHEEALAARARVVFVSSEMVFDGETGGYTEDDATTPTTEYGRQKVEVERHLLERPGNWLILRTGATVCPGVDDNCVVSKTYRTLLSGQARMASDNLLSVTAVGDTARLLLELADHPVTGILHGVANPPVTRAELAGWIAEDSVFGGQMMYEVARFADIPFAEKRPRKSWLRNSRIRSLLGMDFTAPRDAVRDKVKILDRWRSSTSPEGIVNG
ncbi:NAD-dependent epimerase/dehydratase [Paramagnetospirillum caucaseum]|uniref:dTDP-4-dehydrorhamnose reductase n=1 Tax=Paramagnetospirillum caucaseum TaxID=1244869 RepID=M3ADG2_9PROT|nr:sugar nucleotide-binding protein [Paramagnetospirillum caucaseum]EME70539.1 NAD-dependent epimerase/dehydratase [Paramagnetospirillum caucaseum]